MAPDFLTVADVAEKLQISAAAARRLIRTGEIEAIQVGGRNQWRVEPAKYLEYVDRQYAKAREYTKSERAAQAGTRATD